MKDAAHMNFNTSPNDHQSEPLPLIEITRRLYSLLDDIDTASDMAKGDDSMYRNLVHRAHSERFKYASTDGYDVKFNIAQTQQ